MHSACAPDESAVRAPILYVVGTPIGNLSDASQRMVDTLRSVALIAAEDTRVTAKLCSRFDIHTPMISYREHNERTRASELVERMISEGIDIALVSDAGMPALSDPGAEFVSRARSAGISVTCVPGPAAAIAALSLCGWEEKSFAFYGFPPREKKELRDHISHIAQGAPIAILYESPHRMSALLQAAADTPGVSRALICNDLTKRFEWIFEGTPADALAALESQPSPEKGEYCVALRFVPVQRQAAEPVSPEALILDKMLSGCDVNEAVAAIQCAGIPRNDAYRAGLNVRKFIQRLAAPDD
jgi:16S rRNA (cytidine1402-2'-O)-methyltransferase